MKYRYLFLFSVVVGVSSCGGDVKGTAERPSLPELILEIEDVIKTPFADNEEQCRVVAMGGDTCGEPARYLLYSVKNTDEKKLSALLERYNLQAEPVAECRTLKRPATIISNSICIPVEHAEL